MEVFGFTFHIVVIGALSYLLFRRKQHSDFLFGNLGVGVVFWPALILKLLAGISLGLLYKYYYATGDTWTFFQDGAKVGDAIYQNPISFFDFFWNDNPSAISATLENNRPRSLFLVKWVAVFNLISGNNYWITSLYFSFISFVSSWFLFKSLIQYMPKFKVEAAISILLIPSIVFWGSGIIKESLALAALYGMTNCFISWYFRRSVKWLGFVAVLFCLWILWNLKYYWVAVWMVMVVPIVFVQLFKNKVAWVNQNPKWSGMMLWLVAMLVVSIIHPNFYYNNFLLVVMENHEAYLKLSDPNDVIHFHKLEPSLLSVLINSPWALFSGIFRPFIFEAGNLLQIEVGMENLVLLGLFILTLARIRKLWPQVNELHLAVIGFVVLLGIFLALSTPNFGSLARYKIGFTPYLWFGLLTASRVLKKIGFG